MSKKAVPFYLALVHHPVLNRRGELIASAITNLDLHDLARLSCTYDIPACFIVQPLEDQRVLIGRLLSHWCDGVGKEIHPDREQALRRLRTVPSIEAARDEIAAECGRPPMVWASTAQAHHRALTVSEARRELDENEGPWLLLLGTGWGLAPSVMDAMDAVLEPIRGMNGYNHLSVRCAAAILIDRLLGVSR